MIGYSQTNNYMQFREVISVYIQAIQPIVNCDLAVYAFLWPYVRCVQARFFKPLPRLCVILYGKKI